MARKKTTTEFQEEQPEDMTVPAEDTAGENDSPGFEVDAPGVDAAGEGDAPFPMTGEGSTGPDGFPPDDGVPFEDATEGDASGEYDAAGVPPVEDGVSPDEGEDFGDYTAYFPLEGEAGGDGPLSAMDAALPLPEDTGGAASDFGEDAPPGSFEDSAPAPDDSPASPGGGRRTARRERERILTIDPHAQVMTRQELDDMVWHELENASRTRHILTGKLDHMGRTRNGMDVAVVRYKGVEVLIPPKEMMVHTGQVPSGPEYAVWLAQVSRILNARLDTDIDFVVRGIDNADRTVVGSRRDAMRRKRKRFYLDTDELGRHMIEEGSVVQARVVAVAEKALRVEVFGVECNVAVRGSSWLWAGSVRDRHYVGEIIPVRVLKIDRVNVDRITIQVDARDVFGDGGDNLSNCQPQCRYVGQVTDMRRGVVYVRLNNGVNAIAHTCYDARMPGRKDTVSFAVTRLDEAHGIAIGIITRIIKQNL